MLKLLVNPSVGRDVKYSQKFREGSCGVNISHFPKKEAEMHNHINV